MSYLFLHGLGQKASDLEETISFMNIDKVDTPDLYDLTKGHPLTYENMYQSFVKYCEGISEPLHLCGLSLGGMIALNYTIDFPEKVTSLVLIGTQFKMPKTVMKIQTQIFKLLPKSTFEKMGVPKQDLIGLLGSTIDLDFSEKLEQVTCPTLVICGSKDNPNKKATVALEKSLVNARLKWVESAGHVVSQDQPKRLAQLLNEFYGW